MEILINAIFKIIEYFTKKPYAVVFTILSCLLGFSVYMNFLQWQKTECLIEKNFQMQDKCAAYVKEAEDYIRELYKPSLNSINNPPIIPTIK